MKILALDDQPAAMQVWWNALVRDGHELKSTSTTSDAVRAYNEDHFDLILLDRMMPRGDVFAGSDFEMTNDSDTDIDTGSDVYLDMRGREHLNQVPIIILTNYYDKALAIRLEEADSRLTVLPKSTRPSELVALVREVAARCPVTPQEPVIPDDEYPDVAPYFVTDIKTGADVRVYFTRCSWRETEVLEPGVSGGQWDMAAFFEYFLEDEDHCRRVRKMLRYAQVSGPALGLYYSGTGKVNLEWYREVICVTSPWNKRGEAERELKGIGEVLVARFLREWLWRHGRLDEEVEFGSPQFDEPGVEIEAARSGVAFLEAIGFEKAPGTRYYRINAEKASDILDRVTRRKRGPVRRHA